MAKKYRDVQKILRAAGWRRLRQGRGSHEVWGGPEGQQLTLAIGGKANRQVPTGTLASIRSDTGISELR